jgi:pimeloyl-ACP methyl ester carboxylesterase
VIQGLDDEYGTLRHIDTIAAALGARCETLMIDNCGHTPHADQRPIVEQAMSPLHLCFG